MSDAPDVVEGRLDGAQQPDGDEHERDGSGQADGARVHLLDEFVDAGDDLVQVAFLGLGACLHFEIEHRRHVADQSANHVINRLRALLLEKAGADADDHREQRNQREQRGVGEGGGADGAPIADKALADEQPVMGEAQQQRALRVVFATDAGLVKERESCVP